jgi:hypothetical protein
LKTADADADAASMLDRVKQAIEEISVVLADHGPNGRQMADQTIEIMRPRLDSFG